MRWTSYVCIDCLYENIRNISETIDYPNDSKRVVAEKRKTFAVFACLNYDVGNKRKIYVA